MPRRARIVIEGVAHHVVQSCALDEERFFEALRYIEQNPVRAGMERLAQAYPWSSAGAHTGTTDAHPLLDMSNWGEMMEADAWRAALRRRPAKEDVAALRRHTLRGWPLAGDGMLSKLEKRLGRRLRPLPPGRPTAAKDRKKRMIRRGGSKNR